MGYFELMHRSYKWSVRDLLDTDLAYMLDLIIIREKITHTEQLTPIDETGIL